ncbi:hypothetical protein EOL96_02515 [Candidatus Saccharibacteria bacterium]|nr:hypothetical protein [Candidatus Saccharibacteria bacterium]
MARTSAPQRQKPRHDDLDLFDRRDGSVGLRGSSSRRVDSVAANYMSPSQLKGKKVAMSAAELRAIEDSGWDTVDAYPPAHVPDDEAVENPYERGSYLSDSEVRDDNICVPQGFERDGGVYVMTGHGEEVELSVIFDGGGYMVTTHP